MRATRMLGTYKQLQQAAVALKEEQQEYILIADDNPLEAELLRGYLANMDYNVRNVQSGAAALNEVKKNPPLMVISSINLEGVQGYELCHVLKSSSDTSSIPFMFVSASDSTPNKTLGFQQGCDDYITIPLDPGVLKNRVKSLLRWSSKLKHDERELPLQERTIGEEPAVKEGSFPGSITETERPTLDEAVASIEREIEQEPPIIEQEVDFDRSVIDDQTVAQEQTEGGIPTEESPINGLETSAPEPELEPPAQAPASKSPLDEFRMEMAKKVQNGGISKTVRVDEGSYEADVWGERFKPEVSAPSVKAPVERIKPVIPTAESKPAITHERPQPEVQVPQEIKKPDSIVYREAREPVEERSAVGEDVLTKDEIAPVVINPTIPDAESQAAIIEEREEIEQPKYKTLAAEEKLKAEAAVKLNLPTRKQVTHASSKELYRFGIAIMNELQKADGVFGPEEFLSVTSFCDKVAEKATANNELLSMVLSKDSEPGLAVHAVNCSIISLRIGKNLQIQAGDLPLLGAAALLYDIGMIKVNSRIYNKHGELSLSERKEIQNHILYGVKIIENAIKSEFTHECKYITTVILQHHERESGQGYPNKLTGDQISRAGKIVGLADTYEALCHSRYHRSRQTTYRALQEVVGMKKIFFDPTILRALVNELTFFPIGCYVRLNTDEIGVVIDISSVHSMRPKIKVLTDSEGSPTDQQKIVDLVQAPFLYVVKPLDDEDIPEML